MSRLFREAMERRVWRTLVAYPAGAFVLLEAVEFFIQNYGLHARLLTVVLITLVVMFPAAVLWNWMHGPAGRQPVRGGELVAYGVLIAASLASVVWYWATVPDPVVGATAATDPSGQTSIAVLPFTTTGDAAELGFLGDGIAENLITWLSGLDGVRVISRSSSFALRDLVDQPREIGQRLGVGRVLLGRLEQRGDEVVVNVELVNTQDSGRLWGQRFARPGAGLHELEVEIANAIARGLDLGQSGGGSRVAASGARSPEAYRLYLQGRFVTHGSSEVDIDEGLEILRRATTLDPSFTLAYAAIADALTQKALFAVAPSEELIGEARTAANSAIALDPDLSEAWTALASVRFFFDWDWNGAQEAFERAIALGPADATALQRYADLLWSQRRMSEARRIAARALEMDPLDSNVMHAVGITAMWDGDFEAAEAFANWKRLHPNRLWSYLKEGLSLAFLGDCGRALVLAEDAEQRSEGWGSALYQSWLGWVYKLCDRPELLVRAGRRLRTAVGEDRIEDPIAMVFLLTAEGDVDGSIEWIQEAVAERSGSAPFLLSLWSEPGRRIVPAAVLDDPGVLDLLRRMNLPRPADTER